jgi:hypothetical protein
LIRGNAGSDEQQVLDCRPFGQTDMKTVGLTWKCRASASMCFRFILRFPAKVSEMLDSAIPVSVATSDCLVAWLPMSNRSISTPETGGTGSCPSSSVINLSNEAVLVASDIECCVLTLF